MTPSRGQAAPDHPAILQGYAPPSGLADELIDATGAIRPVWAGFIAQLARLSPDAIAAHFARGDVYLRDAGVFYRQYSAEAQDERDWPLSHIPVLLEAGEWSEICAGLAQRAELLERVVADLYGAGRLVTEGHLPADLVARNPEWHRPLVGVEPASGHHLHFLAFEIGRSPDGSWLVLGDRAQAPSGAGFALENRMATTRMFPDPFPRSQVHRLAGFFRGFRDAMDALPGAAGCRTAILTPGPGNDTYYEHAYIARYLGLSLVEGDDLTVRDGAVQLRTVSGLQPVGVLWRRLDAAYADPLELDGASRIGTPGLVDALRQGSVAMVNALGSGILETRALQAFLPKIARHLLGEPLRLPNVATWWCGQAAERRWVSDHAEKLFFDSAMSRSLPFDIGTAGSLPPRGPDQSLADWIEAHGPALVAQEAARLSTTPAWEDGRLVPRPTSIRVFAARTPEGWIFLPGGYARIGRSDASTVLSMQQGGAVADVWIMGDGAAPDDTLIGPDTVRRGDPGMLPSRAADNLYWLGRYVERAEGAIRLLRGYHLRLAETGTPSDDRLRRIAAHLSKLGLDVALPLSDALGPSLAAARISAGTVRDRFAADGWAALTDLTRSLEGMAGALAPGDDTARALGVLLRKITGFNGLVHENMHRSSGWRFLTFGRALERADGAASVLLAFAGADAAPGLPDIALEYADSRITHQRRYRVDPVRDTVVDLVALDADNPRAIVFQLTAMRRIAETLPDSRPNGRVSAVLRALMPLEAGLTVADPSEVTPERLGALRTDIAGLSDLLTRDYLE